MNIKKEKTTTSPQTSSPYAPRPSLYMVFVFFYVLLPTRPASVFTTSGDPVLPGQYICYQPTQPGQAGANQDGERDIIIHQTGLGQQHRWASLFRKVAYKALSVKIFVKRASDKNLVYNKRDARGIIINR